MEPLSSAAVRVLGSLLEKEIAVPATYPMTLNALVTACNQTTGRDPVMTLAESEVGDAVAELGRAGLVRLVHPSHGARTVKHRQVATEAWNLDQPRRAVVAVLALRGPQTAAEIRSRGERIHAFASTDEVDAVLEHLAQRGEPLVVHLARQPGQKEARWAHLLAGPVDSAASAAGPTPAAAGPTPAAATPGATTPAAPAATPPVPPEVAGLADFVGTWVGAGDGSYPTIADFGYTEEIEVRAVPGQPRLFYRSATRAADDGRTLHSEAGFLRVVGDGQVELVVAQGSGIVEAAEGIVEDGELWLTSTLVGGAPSAKSVTATERRYQVRGDELTYTLAMAAVGQALTHHLRAVLRRR